MQSTTTTAVIAALAVLAVGLLNYVIQRRMLAQQREYLDRQLSVALEGQITERFTRAVEQLGHSAQDVRIGGIYALEQIANASERNQTPVAEVLTAFVQGHAPWPPLRDGQPAESMSNAHLPPLRAWAADVQAAMTVLSRRVVGTATRKELNLARVDLRLAELTDADLEAANLRRGGFRRIILYRANLKRAVFARSELQDADLRNAQLQEADLRFARLQHADLGGANLENANLEDAELGGAILGGASLLGAHLAGARLEGASDTAATKWPDGFDPARHGVVRDSGR
jgi:Pentapeptide repeats (8 copies)